MSQEATSDSWFHVKNELYFERLQDGGVRVNSKRMDTVLTLEEMASVIAFLSKSGETSAQYEKAKEFLKS